MSHFEYRVIPAPTKGQKAKGLRAADARFANAMEILLNDMAKDGWEYDRADFLPNEERSGITGSQKTWRNILVFRRPVQELVQTDIEPAPPAEQTAVEAPSSPAPEEIEALPETGQVIPLTSRDGSEKPG